MCLTGTISFAVNNEAPISTSAAEDSTYFIIFAIVKIGPFQRGVGSFSDRKIWAPALIVAFVSLFNPVSEFEVRIVSLERYNMPSLGYVIQ